MISKLTRWSLYIHPRPLQVSSRDYAKVEKILKMEQKTSNWSDKELLQEGKRLRDQVDSGIAAGEVLEAGFALVREATYRAIGIRHYSVQLLAGLALFYGNIAEMATGEGKTLTATLPAFLWALNGRGVHIATANQYLAERDCELMRPIYEALGLSVGVLKEQEPTHEKIANYACDITYGVGAQFGFDYLRDQLALLNRPQMALGTSFLADLTGQKLYKPQKVQRGHAFTLVDEADSIFIDEAKSPLVISGSKGGPAKDAHLYYKADNVAKGLEKNEDYTHDEKGLKLTEKGKKKCHKAISSYQGLRYPWSFYVEQALKANHLFHKDVQYLIDKDEVIIVDEFTGRRFTERTWRDGLHQAVEAKEQLPVKEENKTLARITRQRYYLLYETISGMTGTAQGSENEIWEFYKLPVVRIPRNRPLKRKLLPTAIYSSLNHKWEAITRRIAEVHKTGQPVLVGTRTIRDSETLSSFLEKHKLSHMLLNARQDSEEAEIISHAGQMGNITIATNMAGRGTDIHLEDSVKEKGGLFVLATERHESKRVDNQLIGRCARQGEPGVGQFFLSVEDHLLSHNVPELSKKLQKTKKVKLPERYIRHFDQMQKRMEIENFYQRKQLYRYDNWLEDVVQLLSK